MVAMVAEELAQIPMSPYLAASLERAAKYAEDQAHKEVSLEHVLLALAEDPEASVILRSSDIDIERLQTDVSNFLGNISDRKDPSDQRPVVTSMELQRILEAAAEAAKQGQRREINGAILLAAIVGDGNSSAAHILRAQGLTFEATIAALRSAVRQQTPAAPAQTGQTGSDPEQSFATERSGDPSFGPDPANEDTADDVLARARQRVSGVQDTPAQTVRPEVEPRWEPIAAPEPDEESASDGLATNQTEDDVATEVGSPPPTPRRDAAVPPGSAPQWTPQSSIPEGAPDGRPQPRLQRVPPPLPPDAGLKPPRSQMPPSPPPVADRAPPPTPQSPPAGPAPGQNRGMPAVPPWVGESMGSRGGPQSPRASGTPSAGNQRPRPHSTQIKVETGQLAQNIPRKMKAGVSQLVEVRIARANVKALAQGLQGGGTAYKHDVMITKAMSVKLRAPDGGFWVEAASPETQWIDNVLGVMTDDFASWRWTVTPKSSGRKKLQLVVSARTVGSDGLAAETALPDQIFDIKVAVNYGTTTKRIAGWLAAAVIGGILARFGEGIFDLAKTMSSSIGGS